MTTKFNQEMYGKMRAKKNKPLSNLRKRVVWVVASVSKATRVASPATSVEEITPRLKK